MLTSRSRPQALLIQLEFPTWQTARPWSFSANFAIRDALVANGIECFTVPVIAGIPSSSPASWLFHIKRLCAGRRFDQAWVWLVHTSLDEPFLDWLATVAPVRVGFLMESLRYDPEDYTLSPNLRARPAVLERQRPYLTHLLVPDESDVEELGANRSAKVLWYPGFVPERCIANPSLPPSRPYAVFHGMVYGRRTEWLSHPVLHGRLLSAPSQASTLSQRLFDLLQQATLTAMQNGLEVTIDFLSEYVEGLYRIRLREFSEWMQGLSAWAAIANLQSYAKFYGGRVFEGMAAGRPIISWDIPHHPRNRALFEDGHEILLYDGRRPEALAEQITRIQTDPWRARSIAERARVKLLRYHTAEIRMRQVLDWVATGAEPDYGESAVVIRQQEASAETPIYVQGISTGKDNLPIHSGPPSVSEIVAPAEGSETFCIKPGYTARSQPSYFHDAINGIVCQPDVYPIAAHLGQQLGCSHIIDIGCGHAEKLVALSPQFEIIGIDYGPNIEHCRRHYPSGRWIELNLESDAAIPVDAATLQRSIIICADVIEHLIDPTMLLRNIKSLLHHAPVAILTTPERDLTHGPDHMGPPPNPCHIREWNLEELERLLRSNRLNPLVTGLTNNNDLQLRKENSIVFIGNSCIAPSDALVDAIEAVAARWLDRPPHAGLTGISVKSAAGHPPAPASRWSGQVVTYVKQADAHFAQGNLPAARDTLSKALALVPDDAPLLIAHANIVLRLGDTHGALRECAQATALAPDSAPAHLNLAGVLLMLGRTAEAEASTRRALALNPADADALKLLGRICFETGHHTEGARAYTEALRSNPDDIESLLVLGKWSVEMGDRVAARQMYERALQIEPSNQVARENLDIVMDRVPTEGAGGKRAALAQAPQPSALDQRMAPLRGAAHTPDRMRLLLVVHGFPPKQIGGTELYAFALARELQRRGHTVRVLCPEYGVNQAEGTITHGTCDGLDVARIQVARGDFISQFNNERLLPALRRYVADLAVDLVHIHHLIGISASAPRVFAERGIPMVMTMHDEWLLCHQCHLLQPDGTFCKDGPETVDKCVHCLVGRSGQSALSEKLPDIFYALALRRQVLQKTAGLIDTFIVPSQFIGEKLNRHGFDHSQVTVSPLGLPPFRPLSWRPSRDRLRFVFLGSICFTKGLDLAIRAFNRVDPDKARLDLYGQVLDAVYFNQAMSYVTPGHQVKYHGPYSAADLPSILAKTDVAVIPSRSENYPCVVRESLHAGVPVIAPNVGGVPEILRDGENGLLFEPGDYEDLARKLCFFVGSPNQVMTFRDRVRPVRTISEDADQLETIYKNTLVRRSNAAENRGTGIPTSLQEVQACLHRADDYAAKGDWTAAHDALKEAHVRAPDDPHVIVALGNITLRLGDVEGARREFVKAAALSPEYVPAHSNLAAVLLHLGRAEEAEASARRALALNSVDTDALKVLARLCLDSERYTEAVQAYVNILRHAPGDVETLLTLANCYAEVGRLEDARTIYQRVLQLDPHNVVAAENMAIVGGGRLRSEGAIARTDGPSDEKQTSIIILTLNRLEDTRKCLVSIEANTPEPYELIIVDNGSTDGTLDFLRDYMTDHDTVRVIANLTNRGFAAGNNQGLALARGEYVLLLNNDTIVTQGWLGRMLAVLQRHPEVGVVGPMSNYVSGPQLAPGATYNSAAALEAFAARWAVDHDRQSAVIGRVVGFCLLMRKEIIARIGGLDEQFGSGNYEDDDFCIRAAQIGYTARIAQEVFIHHTGSQTFKDLGIDYRESMQRNWERFKRKWGIPADTPMENGYRLPLHLSDRFASYIPLPNISASHQPQLTDRWWQEASEAGEASQHASSVAEPLSALIVHNGHGLTSLWPSLVQHTNHPLAISVLSLTGNGNGADPAHEAMCPEGWQIKTGDLSSVRLLNQLVQSSNDDPVILLSSDLILTPGWLKRLLAAINRDPKLAAIGPTSNYGAATQRIKADYKGTGKALRQFALRRGHRYGEELAEVDSLAPFCIVFNPAVCRPIGPLREDLDLSASLHDYFARLRQAGGTLGVALDAYVHCDQ